MALIYEIENRQVIPNWRDFKRTTAIGELETNWNRIKTSHLNLSRPIQDWKQNKTIGTAADLVSSAFISSDFQSTEVKEAISFILNNKDHASQTLLDLANRVNGVKQEHPNQNKLLELDLDSVDDIQNLVNNDRIFKYMGIVKRRAYSELKNPIQWVELSRLYSMFNHEDKAEQAMVIAINLAPNNRYVVRSATRLFIHIHKYEKALYYLKKSQLLKGDPWVISAHIATSDLMNRYSPHLKKGIELIDSKNFSDYDLTELSSAICTFEYHNGTAKKTRMFFEKALKKPNDNSLAQMEWLSKQDNHLFNFNALYYKNVPNPFEAYALEQYRQSNWQESINQVIHWFIDLPYSKRPVTLGAYIASTFLEKQDLAVTLCELGLKANPHDPTILNNIIYSLALSNRVQEAEKYMEMLKRVKLDDISAEMKITLQATMGLMSLRSGSNDIGKQLYKLAIDNSVIIKDDYLENLALINFLRELMLIKDSEVDDIAHRIQSIPDINLNADIKFLKTGILKKYNEYKQEI